MSKKKICLSLIALTGMVGGLSACNGETTSVSIFSNPIDTTQFEVRYVYEQDGGEDGLYAQFKDEDPGSYDDTVKVTRYIWRNASNIAGYYEDGAITMEDAVRLDIDTVYGKGYPITTVGAGTFSGKDNIESIHLGSYVSYIGDNAFKGLTDLTDINIADLSNLDYIGLDAFEEVPWITSYAASYTNQALVFGNVLYSVSGELTNSTYKVPSNIVSISPDAFKDHTELTTLDLSEATSLKTIGSNAFDGTSIDSVILPESVESVGAGAFANCLNLTNADLVGNGSVEYGKSILGSDPIENLRYTGSVTIKELLTGEGAFTVRKDFTSLKSIEATGDVNGEICEKAFSSATSATTISLKGAKILDKKVFNGLTLLNFITNTDTVEYVADLSFEDSQWYLDQPSGALYLGKCYMGSKDGVAVSSLKNDTMGVTDGAFQDVVTDVNIPETIMYIGESAFSGCSAIDEISLPNLIKVDDGAFENCINLQRVLFADNAEMGSHIFYNDLKITDLSLPYGDKLSDLFSPSSDFSVDEYDIPEIENYTFMDGPTEIVSSMFENVTTLKTVVFNSTITTIGSKAFRGCTSLTAVDFPLNIVEIKSLTFAECTSLSSVTYNYEEGVTEGGNFTYFGLRKIGSFAFLHDTSLTGEFLIPRSMRSVAGGILSGTGVTSIKVEVLDYYTVGVNMNQFPTESTWMIFSKDWNSIISEQDDYKNPIKIPYTIVIIDTPVLD